MSKRFENQKIECQNPLNLTPKYTVTLTSSATSNLLECINKISLFQQKQSMNALEARNGNLFLNVRKLRTIFAKLLVATATSERSFSIK